MRTWLAPVVAVLALSGAGCGKDAEEAAKNVAPRSTDLGTGLNAVERDYPLTAAAMADVVRSTLTSFDLTLKDDRHDALGGDLSATRADGHEVHARITAVGKERARVSIRVAPGNRDLAELIHRRLAERTVVEPHAR
jgi:hypothetical protein